MRNVRFTKNPSTLQMCNMADNLRDHYKVACKITIESFAFVTIPGETSLKFTLYIANDICHTDLTNWKDLQKKYLYYIVPMRKTNVRMDEEKRNTTS